MGKHNINIQDGFLFQNLKEAQVMHVELVTGRTLVGRLKRFDRFAVVIESGGNELLVYKHAISTIATAGPPPPPPQA
ncbi:MAG TPA: RNA chaperone Hfq [Thermoanaerobaculia bacterium]|nr:RNA chaperone Hfq [Thermoanaerobaculia bacterium]